MHLHSSVSRLLLLMLLFMASTVKADVVLLRDGSEINCTIRLVNDTDIKYLLPRNNQQMSVPTTEVYMLKFNRRGNVYITTDGKRVTGENQSIPKDAEVVYLVCGKELPAFNLSVDTDCISFLTQKPSKKNIPVATTYSRAEVFKIVYRDGSIDIITRLDAPASAEEDPMSATTAEYQAVIHTVSPKETLASIASRYGVKVEEIMEWNSLDARLAPTSEITTGRQLMIYVLPMSDNK